MERGTGQVIEWLQFDVEQPLPPQVQYASLGLRTAQLLDGGETQTVEWKGAVGDGPAIGEFFESVTAFANTNNGIILIGVDDHGEVLGVGVQGASALKSRILDLAETRCEPIPEGLQFQTDKLGDKEVLIMTVPLGTNRPYILRRDGPTSRTEIMVRRGDKDRPARRNDIDAYYAERNLRQS